MRHIWITDNLLLDSSFSFSSHWCCLLQSRFFSTVPARSCSSAPLCKSFLKFITIIAPSPCKIYMRKPWESIGFALLKVWVPMISNSWVTMTFWIWTIFFMNLMMMTILVKKDFIFSNNRLFPMPLFYEAFFTSALNKNFPNIWKKHQPFLIDAFKLFCFYKSV